MKSTPMLEKGLEFHRAGQLRDAESVYRQVLRRWPQQADALYLLGLVVQQEGSHLEAVTLFTQSANVNPQQAAAHLQKGFSLRALGRTDEAASAFRTATSRQPNLSEAHHQLGNTLRALHRLPEAIVSLREATRLAPNDALMWLSRGIAHMESQQLDEAVESFQQAIRLDSKLPEAREILGQALLLQHKTEEARAQFEQALSLRPVFPEARHDLGRAYAEEGRLSDAVEEYCIALESSMEAESLSNLVFLLNYLPETTPDQLFAQHQLWETHFGAPQRPHWLAHGNDPTPGRRLRIGYVSPDLKEHAVVSFFEPTLQGHNRAEFEIFCYANVASPDAVTDRLRQQADKWRDIYHLPPTAAAELIRQDGIDILVDLAGHTTGNSLQVFARKPAPVQVTWIGYPNTTGLSAIDYRITDHISDPPGQTERWHTEQLLRLPETFSCYRPQPECPEVSPLPALTAGHITFGCFNNFRKISDSAIALWAQLLSQMPTARLFLKSPGLKNPTAARLLLEKFAHAGVSADRIEMHGSRLPAEQHFGLYSKVDITLDPFPYNGTTTTCEALWMGAPVITLAGQTHVARVGASLVTHLGFPDWAAGSPEAYIAKCRELAGDLPRLAEIRAQLRERMRQSPLCDAPRFLGHLEHAFRSIWTRWCETSAQPKV
jgi:predicted O-linked N-acetylglucosamine transferase (SPINDLY family)